MERGELELLIYLITSAQGYYQRSGTSGRAKDLRVHPVDGSGLQAVPDPAGERSGE